MNAACPRRVSLIIAGGLPAIPTPTISAPTGDRPVASGFTPAPTGFAFHSQARPATPTESSSRRTARRPSCVSDWSFSFRCSPPRLTATQLRFDTARFFTAQERTSTTPSPRLLRRTSAATCRRRSRGYACMRRTGARRSEPRSCRASPRHYVRRHFHLSSTLLDPLSCEACSRQLPPTFRPPPTS